MTGVREKTCYVFVPGAMIGLENALPFAVSLNERGWRVVCVIIHEHMSGLIGELPDYKRILEEVSEVVHVGFDTRNGKFRKLLAFARFLTTVARMALTRDPRIVTLQPVKEIFLKTLALFSCFKGHFYVLSKANCPIPFSRYSADDNAMKDPESRRMMHKKRTSLKAGFMGRHLMHSHADVPVADLLNMPADRIVIGYPKLMEAWRKRIADFDTTWDSQELAATEKIVTVILIEPNVYFFDPDDAPPTFLREILNTVRKHFPDELIVLKTKPIPQFAKARDYSWIDEILEERRDPRVVMTNVPNPFLARKSLAVFAVGESTACFDYVAAGVPFVEHSRYGEAWLKIYPRGSFWTEYGMCHTQTPAELDAAVSRIKNGSFPVLNAGAVREKFGQPDEAAALDSL